MRKILLATADAVVGALVMLRRRNGYYLCILNVYIPVYSIVWIRNRAVDVEGSLINGARQDMRSSSESFVS